MSIMGTLSSIGTGALAAYGMYTSMQGSRGGGMAAGAGGRALTGAVAGAAGYLAGRDRGDMGPMRRRRSRGLSASELRGFRRTVSLLKSVGMVPRKLHTAKRKR